jgi:hypothetical protein
MMFLKTILALSFAALALTAPTPQGGLGPDTNLLDRTSCQNPCPPGASLTDLT